MIRSRTRHFRASLALGIALILSAIWLASVQGCRHKLVNEDNGGDGNGSWQIQLRAPAIMYRDANLHVVSNDTIVVRVYNPAGAVHGGAVISAQSLKDPHRVTPLTTTQEDTLHFSWGCQPALIYFGAGDPDPMVPEIVTVQAVVIGDTVAKSEVRFLVRDGIQLALFGSDTLYRDDTGTVPHARIGVRLFSETGGILGGVPVHCQCEISRDSVSAVVTTAADTASNHWGANPPITYWGGGDPLEPQHQETVTCWAAVNGDTTRAHKNFFVWSH